MSYIGILSFPDTFRTPNGRFPAIYDICDHFRTRFEKSQKMDFLVILTILAKLADICSGRGWPEVAGGIIYGQKHVLPGH